MALGLLESELSVISWAGLALARISSSASLRLRTSIVLEEPESSGSIGASWRSGIALSTSLVKRFRRSRASRLLYSPVGWPSMSRIGNDPVVAAACSKARYPVTGMARRRRSISTECDEALVGSNLGILGFRVVVLFVVVRIPGVRGEPPGYSVVQFHD